jgi:hypothetical protein
MLAKPAMPAPNATKSERLGSFIRRLAIR